MAQARPDGAQAAHDKRKWYEEKQRRQDEDLGRLGVGKAEVGMLTLAYPINSLCIVLRMCTCIGQMTRCM